MLLATLLLSFCQAQAPASSSGLTPKEALALAFPECKVERVVHYPDKKQLARATKLVGSKVTTKTVRAYRATDKKGKLVGTAYFDSHKVRTKAQTLFIVVDPQHKVLRVEVLRFDEPPEYKPKAKWFGKFKGMKLDKQLHYKQGIPALTGATLSARVTTTAVRRTLAWHQIFYPKPAKPKKDGVDAKR